MPITEEEAYNATDPGAPEEQRRESAARIMAGVAANDAYWNSRSQLEAIAAFAQGHGPVARGADSEEGSPTVVGTGTAGIAGALAAGAPPPTTAPGGGGVVTPEGAPAPTATEAGTTPETPTNDTEAVAKLRAQVESLGGTPEA